MGDPMYIFFTEAVAGDESKYRPGARHALIVYVTGTTSDEAQEKALREVDGAGWIYPRVITCGPVVNEALADRHPIMQQALDGAREAGASMIVYTEEIPHNA
ncbi:hypothetical protein [Amaricoccus macauensis]|uniref:hypothetical protein n=1 Tax=Amaricoccus macauensis TaxID=57001 RepID=UPI003C7A7512